jgi:hypothetical protein
MVGTAQADNFAVFVRKVGYSVGLEFLLTRARDFGEAYANTPSFRDSDWTELVDKKWNITNNIADVFGALDLARVQNREVYPGLIGEALGILAKLHGVIPKEALELLIASAIVKFDGDIFLNGLRHEFNEQEVGKALVRMIEAKREALFEIFSVPRDREAIARTVSIERQRSNKGSASGGGLAGLTRSQPLGAKALGLGLPQAVDVYKVDTPSPDYLRKVSVSRRGWAESLGLFAKGRITPKGDRFLVGLANSGFAKADGTFLVWPTLFELESNQFRVESFQHFRLLSSWEFQLALFRSLGGKVPFARWEKLNVSQRIGTIYEAYRSLSQHRSMIRNEVSSNIVSSVLLAEALANGNSAPDIGAAWQGKKSLIPSISIRSSKSIEYAITVRPDARQTTQ